MIPTSRVFLVFAFMMATITSAAVGQNTSPEVNAEIQRLQEILKSTPAKQGSDFAGVHATIGESLSAAKRASDRGDLYLALEKLGEATDLLRGLEATKNDAGVVKGGLPAFESLWGKASLELTALDKQARSQDWSGRAAAIRALAEAAQGRAIPLLDGGRGFATSTKPEDGLFYVGQAKGEAEFAKFCASLKVRTD